MPHTPGHFGPPAPTGGGGGDFGSFFGNVLGGLGSFFDINEDRQRLGGIENRAGFASQGFGGFGGQGRITGTSSQFGFDPLGQAIRGQLGGAAQGFLGGGLFNNPDLQAALGANNIFGALGQANQAFGQQAGPSAFGGLSGLFGQQAGLSNLFANQVAGGPQDFTGGLQGNLFGTGFANQLQAGDQSALFNQSLATQRAAAQPEQNRLLNQLQNRQFAQGRLGSTGGAGETEAFFNALNQQDLGFQNNAFSQAQQRAQLLGGLGSQQIGQGAGLLGQNLGQFNQAANFANLFGQGAAGIEGQQFGQNLGALGFNTSQGQGRLQNALGLLGFGGDLFGQQFGLGLGAQGAIQDQNRFGLDTILGLRNAEADRIQAAGASSRALADSGGSGFGNFLGGVLGGIGGLFSDQRLKDNIKRIGSLGDLNWYEWEWNEDAKKVGADSQPNYGVIAQEVAKVKPDAVTMYRGYLTVNYKDIY